MSGELDSKINGKAEFHKTIIIGGGQAGLATGYFLAHQKEDFVILDKYSRSGDAWRCRWESLCLFTPSQFDSLPGKAFSKAKNTLPTKNEIADYMEDYASHFNLPVRHNTNVDCVRRDQQYFDVAAGRPHFQAQNVIIATGPFQLPVKPAFSKELDPDVFQLHSSDYHNPDSVPAKSVLVVGAGNSGAEIALELHAAGKQVWLAGRDVGQVPANSPLGKVFDGRLIWWIMTHLMTLDTPIGRKMQSQTSHRGTPLGRLHRKDISQAGVRLVPRMAGVQSGKPQLEDGSVLPVEGVLWATGFRPDYRWLDLPVLDARGLPRHERGKAVGVPNLYFVGLIFQTGLSSAFLGGVGKDAAYIAGQIANQPE